MRRREFIAGLGGAAAWPLAARAQQRALPVVAVIRPGPNDNLSGWLAGFRKGLGETGTSRARTRQSSTTGWRTTLIACRR